MFSVVRAVCSTLFLDYSECSFSTGGLLNQSRVRNGKAQEKKRQLCTPTRKKTETEAAALPQLQTERKAQLSRFPATPDNVSLPPPPRLHSGTSQRSRTKKVESTRFEEPQSLPGRGSLPLHNWGLGPCFCNQSFKEGRRRVPQRLTLPAR